MLRAASISRRRCASTAKLLDLMWTRVVVLTESGTDSDSDGCTVANAANAAFAAQLVSLPRVWRRGGDPATTWPSSVATLFAMTREASAGGASCRVCRVSFPDPPFAEDRRRGHSGYAAAWALGNLVEGASAGLETRGSRARSGARRRGSPRRRRRCSGGYRRGRRSHRRWTTRRWTTRRSSVSTTRVRPWTRKTRKSLPSRTAAPRATTKTTRARRARRRDDVALLSPVRRFAPRAKERFRSCFVPSTRTHARRSSPRSTRGSSRCSWTRAWWTRARRTKAETLSPSRRTRRRTRGTPTFPATAAAANEAGARAISSFVAALAARLRSADRGALMSSLAFGTPFIARAWRTFSGFCRARRWPKAAKDEGEKKQKTAAARSAREALAPLLRRTRRPRTRAG